MKNLIFDGNNLIHRTFWTAKHVSQQETDIAGLHVYLTLNSVKSVIQKFKPDRILAVWDTSLDREKRIRVNLCSDYKGNRSTDSTPHNNTETIIQCFKTLGIPSIYPTALEADDVISFLVDTLEGENIIVSADRDFLQKINKNTTLYDPIRKTVTNVNNFEEAVKCKREDFMKLKCLMGDKSDNVSGIPGYGKVKANKVINNVIKLTEEEQLLYNRNYEIFRLDRYLDESCVEEYQSYTKQLQEAEEPTSNFTQFIEICKKLDIQNVISKKEEWYSIFFQQSKLLSLLNDRY